MSLKDDILSKAKEIRNADFKTEIAVSVPTINTSKLTFGCTGLTFDTTVLYIDMRGSTKVLNEHTKKIVAKIHMIYYHAIVKIAKADGGSIRSFNGDSLLVFFRGNGVEITRKAVRSALKMQYAITSIINETLKNYTEIDFGIGIDYGEVLATKVGIGGLDETKDLIWMGNAVNRSTRISDLCNSPYYVGISKVVYDRLDESLLYCNKQSSLGFPQRTTAWTNTVFTYNEKMETMYKTNCNIRVD